MDLYIKGDIGRLNHETISIIINNKAAEREFNALVAIIDQLSHKDIVFIVELNSSVDSDLLKEIITRGFYIVVVIPTGILQLKLRKDIKEMWDNNHITTISLFPPNQTWTKYNNVLVAKFIISISKTVLINTIDVDCLKYLKKSLYNHLHKFFINYWSDKNDFFSDIRATPIGKNSNTGLPNIRAVKQPTPKILQLKR